MSAQAENPRRFYANIRDLKLSGPFGLPVVVWAALAAATFILLVLLVFGLWPLAIAGAFVLALFTVPLKLPTRTGQNVYQRLAQSRSGKRARTRGTSALRQGPAGHVPDGACRLPGLAAASGLTQWRDALGMSFGLLSIPKTDHHTVVIDCNAAGTMGLDQSVIDTMLDHWSGWLGSLGETGDIVAASVVVETARDTGHRVRRDVLSDLDPDAPAACRQAVVDTVATASGAPLIQTWITITFTGRPWVEDRKSAALSTPDMAREIASRLPSLLGGLKATGAGEGVRPMTAQEIVDVVRVSYDPSAADDVALAQLESEHGTGLSWHEAGPVAADVLSDRYLHDGASSRSWYLLKPPPSKFYETVLQPLLAPHGAIARKRVAILFRPHSPEESVQVADRDVRNTTWESSTKNRETAAARRKKTVAQQIEDEQADGATLLRFGMVATVTVDSEDHLALASKTLVSSLAAPARLKLRLAREAQDVAFAASLPIGLVLPEHMNIPAIVRETM